MNVDRAPVVRLGGGEVLLRGSALRVTARLARYGADQVARKDGSGLVSAQVQSLLTDLEQEARLASAAGPPDVGMPAPVASSVPDDPLSTREVAEMMQCTARHVRRIAETLGGRRVGGRCWVFSAETVAAHLAVREELA